MMALSGRRSDLGQKLIKHFLNLTFHYQHNTAVRTFLKLVPLIEHINMMQILFHELRRFKLKGSIQKSHAAN